MAKPSFKALVMHAIRRAEKELTPAYQQLLRQHASTMPEWGPEDVNNINMRYKNGGHVITYSDDSVLDKENGTPDIELSPAMRTFMLNRAGK
jgi:hypothetical protein